MLEWKQDQREWVARAGSFRLSVAPVVFPLGFWDAIIASERDEHPEPLALGSYPSREAAQQALVDAPALLRAAADALSPAPSPGKAGAFEESEENVNELWRAIAPFFEQGMAMGTCKAVLAWARAQAKSAAFGSRAADPLDLGRLPNPTNDLRYLATKADEGSAWVVCWEVIGRG